MPFTIIRNDITKVKADAIVNTANPLPVVGGGTDSAIYEAAGKEKLLRARQAIGPIARGEAVHTPAFKLKAKYIIHTVGPVWQGGLNGESETLASCYRNCLRIADELKCESVAFPLISTGVYDFPRDRGLSVALSEISAFLMEHEMKVILVVFDPDSFRLSERLVGEIDQFIDDLGAEAASQREYRPLGVEERLNLRNDATQRSVYARNLPKAQDTFAAPSVPAERASLHSRRLRKNIEVPFAAVDREQMEDVLSPGEAAPEDSGTSETQITARMLGISAEMSLDELITHKSDSFQTRLLQLIDQSGMDDVTVYKRANIDRKLFSSIRCKKNYRPKKLTAVAFAIALRLDMPTMTDLLSRAGIALSPSSTFDLIISYFVSRRFYDIYEINAVLFKYGEPLLGQ